VYRDDVAHEWAPRAAARPVTDSWRPTRSLGAWLIAALTVEAVASIVLAVVDTGHAWVRLHDALRVGSGDVASRQLSHSLDDIQPWTSIYGWVSVAVLVLSIVWTFRSTRNARAAGRTGARWTPGWTIAGWLVPFLNIVLPYQAWSDLWRNSQPDAGPGDEWRARPASPLVIGWWFLHLGGQIVVSAAVGVAVIGDLTARDARPLLVAGHLAMAAGALLGVLVVRTVTRLQEARQAEEPAPTPQPVARSSVSPTTVDGPGWYPDPGGSYDHRYWDGRVWTEHVSTGGEATTAPVTPADWYPDPTGRFHWRYWTGHEWTEHVSRDEQLFVDPLSGPSGGESGDAPLP
jgi:hypothetical protein